MSDRSSNPYSKQARAARSEAHESSSFAEIIPPGRKSGDGFRGRWNPRDLEPHFVTMPSDEIRRKFFSGRIDYDDAIVQKRGQAALVDADGELQKALARRERALQDRELAHEEREFLPQRVEILRIGIDISLLDARQRLAQMQANAEAQGEKLADAALTRQRDRELNELDFEIEKQNRELEIERKRSEAVRAKADAEYAPRTAKAQAEATALAKEAELEEARRKAEKVRTPPPEEPRPEAVREDGIPPEMAQHLRNTKRRRSYDAVADEHIQAILSSVGGDESKLTAEQKDEIDDWREAAQEAKSDLDKAAADFDFPMPNGRGA